MSDSRSPSFATQLKAKKPLADVTTLLYSNEIHERGYVIVPAVFDNRTVCQLADRLASALHERTESSVLRSRGRLYGSRNLIEAFPEVSDIPRQDVLRSIVLRLLGRQAGLVRALYFDKPPDRSWSLPWHRDRTIAVKRNNVSSASFCKPTVKSGIPHVEAPDTLLSKMLTLRLHLDAMTAENGPLSVLPGSHLGDGHNPAPAVELHAEAGDVLAMRPLLSHSSSMSRQGTQTHRRIIHLELAPEPDLPDGFEWHDFIPVAD